MANLGLDPELVGPKRNRISLIPIEATMLFPDDPQWWDWAVGAAIVEYRRQNPNPSMQADPSESAALTALLTMQHNTPSWAQIQKRAKSRLAHGSVASAILYNALTLPGGGKGLSAIKSALQERLSGRHEYFQKLSLSTIDNTVWKIFSRVSHLHLAYALLLAARGGQAYPFPCDVVDLPVFLKTAENIRLDAERTPLRQKVGALLDARLTWKVPTNCLSDCTSLWPLDR
jgi:hypothetical protein